jgi:glycerol uptake facilitator-like aquaporin
VSSLITAMNRRKAMIRKLAVEFLGTAILVFFAVGVATLMFGFRFAGTSVASGVVATALAFGLAAEAQQPEVVEGY